jgi:predicted NACHT family NTPase
MPRINYGNAVKQRTLQLLTILIDYANDEIDLADRLWENFQRQIQLQWQTDRRLVVRTKIRHLEELVRAVGADLSGDEIKEAIARATDFLGVIEDNRSTRGGSENWHFTLNLWHSRFDRSANLDRVEIEWTARKSGGDRGIVLPSTSQNLDRDIWFDRIKNTLQQQEYQRVTTNALMVGTGRTFDLDRLYIPMLGSIDRVPDEAKAEDEIETSTVIDPDRFFEGYIAGEGRQRLGIIGEPGAGKTTLLQRWATKLIDRQLLPIWVSCADLAGDSLESYLLDRWLKMATKSIEVEAKTKQELVDRFRSGKVWLLLDAIDESSGRAHSQILAG